MASSNSCQNKIIWLSIIQGWAILLVIIGHVNGFNYHAEGELYPFSLAVHKFCYSFHMPLFMFVSGGLLYLTRISREWGTLRLYKDKVRRLMIPFVFFTTIAFLIKIPFAGVSKSGLDMSVAGFLNAFFDPSSGPLKEMWFVGTLMWLMLLYPVYKTALKYPVMELVLLGVSIVPFISGVGFNIKGWFSLSGIADYGFYFLSGILFFKYNCLKIFEIKLWPVVIVTLLYVAAFVCIDSERFNVATAVLGILMSFGWGVRVVKVFPKLFGSFRDHSFQIFLVGIFPQMFLELLVWKRIHSEAFLVPFYFISVVAALAVGVLVSKIGSKISFPFLRWCLGLK